MLTHAADQLRMALGQIPPGPPVQPFRSLLLNAFCVRPLNKLTIHYLPWPRGRITGPSAAFTTGCSNWDEDTRTLIALVEKMGQQRHAGAWPRHPVFGHLTGQDYGVLCFRHLDHHLRQFGC